MQQAQENLLCHSEQVRKAQHADQLRVNTLEKEQLELLEADLKKTELIRQYREQELLFQQEIQRCQQEVEQIKKGQAVKVAQTLQGLSTPVQPSQAQTGSQHGSTVRTKNASSRGSRAGVPVDLNSSKVIDARPISKAPKPFQFTQASSQHSGSPVTQSQGAIGGKQVGGSRDKGDILRSKSVRKS